MPVNSVVDLRQVDLFLILDSFISRELRSREGEREQRSQQAREELLESSFRKSIVLARCG